MLVYQEIRQTITGRGARLSIDQHVALSQRISAAIEQEEIHSVEQKTRRGWQKPVAGLAVAASLVVAIGVGVKTQDESTLVSSGQIPITSSADATRVVSTTPVETLSSAIVPGADEPDQELRELDEDKQRMLRAYLNQHDRMTRLKGQVPQMVNNPRPARN